MKFRLPLPLLLVAALLCSIVITSTAQAQQQGQWWHNGSIVKVDIASTPDIIISYLNPRPGMQAAGAYPGAVVLRIYSGHNGLIGEAFIFKRGCQPAPYRVQVNINEGGGYIFASGAAAVFARHSCEVIGYAWNDNSRLLFTFQRF